jgi:hypothetical protein
MTEPAQTAFSYTSLITNSVYSFRQLATENHSTCAATVAWQECLAVIDTHKGQLQNMLSVRFDVAPGAKPWTAVKSLTISQLMCVQQMV